MQECKAQGKVPPSASRADSLIDEGRWSEAESIFYAQSQRAPRDPVKRAALGRFIAMKGAVRTGMVLIEEAQRFGLAEDVSVAHLAPLRAILDWRVAATTLKHDSTLIVRVPEGDDALFRIQFSTVTAPEWHDVVDRAIGLDSVRAAHSPIGIEVLEALVPSLDVKNHSLTLSSNQRSALSATGRRYSVLRTVAGVRVLMDDRRVLSLAAALRELSPAWWQIDLLHGLLVVR